MAVNQDDKFVEYWQDINIAIINWMAIGRKGKLLLFDNTLEKAYILDRQSGVLINATSASFPGGKKYAREKAEDIMGCNIIVGGVLKFYANINLDEYKVGTPVTIEASGTSALYDMTWLSSSNFPGLLYAMTAGPTYKIAFDSTPTKITIYQNEVAQTNPESMTPLNNQNNGCMRSMIDTYYALFNYGDATNPYFNLYVMPTGGSTWSSFYTNYVDNTPLGTYLPYNIVSFEVAYNGDIIALAIDRDSTGAASEIRLLRIDTEGRLLNNYLVDTLTDANLQFCGDSLAYDGDELACINLRDKSGSDYYNYIYVVDIYSGLILNKYIPPTTTSAVSYGIALHIGGSRFACTYNYNKIMII